MFLLLWTWAVSSDKQCLVVTRHGAWHSAWTYQPRESFSFCSESLKCCLTNSMQAVLSFSQEGLPSCYSTMKAALRECCEDGCPFRRFPTSAENLWNDVGLIIGLWSSSQPRTTVPLETLKSFRNYPVPLPQWSIEFLESPNLIFVLTCSVICGTWYTQVFTFLNCVQLI